MTRSPMIFSILAGTSDSSKCLQYVIVLTWSTALQYRSVPPLYLLHHVLSEYKLVQITAYISNCESGHVFYNETAQTEAAVT